jgi:hypothetical protein
MADRADALGGQLFSVVTDLLAPPKGAPYDYQTADPRPLYRELISFAHGADWLLARWRELLGLLEVETCWADFDQLRAAVLLGKRPGDALLDPALVRLFLACYPGEEERPWGAENAFFLAGAAGHPRPCYEERIKALLRQRPRTPEAGRAVLRSIAQEQIAALEALQAAELDELNALDREEAILRARCDDSRECAALRREESALERDLHRALADLMKLQRPAGRALPDDGCGNEAISETENSETFASDDPCEIDEFASDASVEIAPAPTPSKPAVAPAPTPRPPAAPAGPATPPAAACGNELIAGVVAVTRVMPNAPAPPRLPVAFPLGVRMVVGAEKNPVTDVAFRHGHGPG